MKIMSNLNNNWAQVEEIRKHIIFCLKAFTLIMLGTYPFNQQLYQKLAQPLMLGQPHVIIATKVISPFTTPLKLCLFASFALSMPIMLWRLWLFLKPAMKHKEKTILTFLLIFGCGLFFAGLSFCFLYVLPSTIQVFQNLTPKNVIYMPGMDEYLDFTLSLLTAFGLSFEIPVILVTLVKLNIIAIENLVNKRKEVVIACFILGMLLTPPDVTSQILLALPMWGLFELSLLIARII